MMSPLTDLTKRMFLLLIFVSAGESELICPDVGYLGSPAHLTCISPSNVTSHGYTASQGGAAAICNVSNSSCTPIGDYRGSIINQTHSLLTIPAVQPGHAGEWKCADVEKWKSSCNLIVVKLPNCYLTRQDQVTGPEIKEGVSLGVNIMGYYCSQLTQLNISTGDNITVFPHENITNTTDKTESINVNKSDSNIEVELTFACGDHRWNISCITDNNDEFATVEECIANQCQNTKIVSQKSNTCRCYTSEWRPIGTTVSNDVPRPTPPVKKKERNYIIIGVVVSVVLIATTIIIRCIRKRNLNRKAPPLSQCADPPYVEVIQACNNRYASVEDLTIQGRASTEDSCAEVYAETGFYEAVGDKNALNTGKDDSRVLIEAGGYSTVADRNSEQDCTKDDGTPDTENYKAVNECPREYGARLEDQPVLFDVAGYSTVGDLSPRPSDGPLRPDLKESRMTNKRLSELYAKVNKKKGTPGLANSDVTFTSRM